MASFLMADIPALKTHVATLAANPAFIHHQWFMVHHLEIIEQIVEELLTLYPQANFNVTRAMVWVHDLGKIITNKGADEEAITHAQIQALTQFGFTPDEISLIDTVYAEMESLKPTGTDFHIETKIISSADALSHYVGPFFGLYWYENSDKPIDDLIAGNLKKATKDEGKILLPEVRRAAQSRIALLRENHPSFRPKSYLS